MSDQPPPYKEDAAGTLIPSKLLVVHLQVWHSSSEGRSPKKNSKLATLFRENNLEHWEVNTSLELAGVTGTSCQDGYVPVEVRFRHRNRPYDDPTEHAMHDVRYLFNIVGPRVIRQFFLEIESTPHNRNIFPVDVPIDYRSRYTHACVLDQFSVRNNVFIVRGPITGGNNTQSWLPELLGTVDITWQAMAIVITIYLICQAGTRPEQVTNLFNTDLLEQFRSLRTRCEGFEHGNGHDSAQEVDATPDLQGALKAAAGHYSRFSELVKGMDNSLSKLETNCDMTYGDLYKLVKDAHGANLHFSNLMKTAPRLAIRLQQDYNTDADRYKTNRIYAGGGGALAGAAVVYFCPVALPWMLGGFLGGGVAGLIAHYFGDLERGQASTKAENAEEFRLAIKEVDKVAKEVWAAIAILFYAQVMQRPLDDSLPETVKKQLLNKLGVDVAVVAKTVYSKELMKDRLRKFREAKDKLETLWNMVLNDANCEVWPTQEVI